MLNAIVLSYPVIDSLGDNPQENLKLLINAINAQNQKTEIYELMEKKKAKCKKLVQALTQIEAQMCNSTKFNSPCMVSPINDQDND